MYSLVGLMHFFGQPTKNVAVFSSVQASPQVSPVAGTAKEQREPGSRAGEGNQPLGALREDPELGGTGQGVQISQGRRRNSELQCEQLFFIVHLLKQRAASVLSTTGPQ